MAFGNTLERYRQAKNFSQKELANMVGVPTGRIAEWEADELTPNLAELSRLSKALQVSADVLLEVASEEESDKAILQQEKSISIHKAKRTKQIWVIGAVALGVALLITVAAFLWPKGKNEQESLLFSENTTKIEAADASVVTIFCYDYEGELAATGSGFIAFDSQTVVTNYHVMTSAYTCKVSTNQDITYEVTGILNYSKEQDIAILKLGKDTGLQPLTLGNSAIIKKGETVVAIGSPLGIKNTVSTGVLSGRLMEKNMDVLQFTAPISSGSSGGALFDSSGYVIGVTYASYVDGQNLNLAIPSEFIGELYEQNSTEDKVSRIYLNAHPYVSYLERMENVPAVTMSDLKINPKKYDDKVVKLTAYVSSVTLDSDEESKYSKIFVSDKSDVSFDIQQDYWYAMNSGMDFEDTPCLDCWIRDCWTPEKMIQAGDKVVVIGTFHYTAKGEKYALMEGTYTSSIASIDPQYIYLS